MATQFYTQVLDRYAPLKKKRLVKKRSPRITYIVVQKVRYRDNLKKQYEMTRNDVLWKLYKNARNDVNKIIKQAKCDYFKNKIDAVKKDPKQTWKLINELSSRKTSNTASVKVIKHHDREVTNATAIANAFNLHFTSIGEKLASEIENTNINPTSYINPWPDISDMR